jgi:hypothetical protein
MTTVISVMAPDNRGEFAGIWIPWLRSMGREPETEDLEIMADPARYYRDAGGEAFLAKIDGKTVGTVAIKRLGDDGFEFCKLVVTQTHAAPASAPPWCRRVSILRRARAQGRSISNRSTRLMLPFEFTGEWDSSMPTHRIQ